MLPCVLDPKSAAPKKPIRAYTTKAIPVTCTPKLQHDAPLPVLGLHACVHQVEDVSYSVHCNSRHATFECKYCVTCLSGIGGSTTTVVDQSGHGKPVLRQAQWLGLSMGHDSLFCKAAFETAVQLLQQMISPRTTTRVDQDRILRPLSVAGISDSSGIMIGWT